MNIDYHIKMGVQRVYIIDRNASHQSTIDRRKEDWVDTGLVEYTPFTMGDILNPETFTRGGYRDQKVSLPLCGHEHKDDFWMLTIDKDEFFSCNFETRNSLFKRFGHLSSNYLTGNSKVKPRSNYDNLFAHYIYSLEEPSYSKAFLNIVKTKEALYESWLRMWNYVSVWNDTASLKNKASGASLIYSYLNIPIIGKENSISSSLASLWRGIFSKSSLSKLTHLILQRQHRGPDVNKTEDCINGSYPSHLSWEQLADIDWKMQYRIDSMYYFGHTSNLEVNNITTIFSEFHTRHFGSSKFKVSQKNFDFPFSDIHGWDDARQDNPTKVFHSVSPAVFLICVISFKKLTLQNVHERTRNTSSLMLFIFNVSLVRLYLL